MKNRFRRSPKNKTPNQSFVRKLASPFVITGLMAAGQFQLIPQAIALGTSGGTTITNRATATYEDPEGNEINAISNEVEVTVANVAGITVVSDKIVDLNGGAVEAGDILNYYFTVTNIGNVENIIRVPTTVTIQNLVSNGTDSSTLSATNGGRQIIIVYDADGNGQIDDGSGNGTYEPGDTGPEIWVPTVVNETLDYVNSNGDNWSLASEEIPADDSFTVIVQADVPTSGLSSGEPLSVSLGQTSPDDGLQNVTYQESLDSENNPLDVYTVNDTTAYDLADYVNGQREAAASRQSIAFASDVNPLALAVIKKTGTYTPNEVDTYTDDTITYNLDLEVRDDDPTQLFQPASLAGTTITLDDTSATRILVSDQMPVDADGNLAVLQSVSTNLPAGWQVVYTTDASTVTPTNVQWWTTFGGGGTGQPANLAAVTRIGFIYNGSLPTGYDTAAIGDTLSFTVVLSNSSSSANTLAVYNIAQILGTTQGGDGTIVYDESGDNQPNNFNDDGTPGDPYDATETTGDTGSPLDEDEDNPQDGLQADELDDNNNNTGSGPSGEPNLITALRTIADDILIGPDGAPSAIGPDGTQNTDFTNKSVAFTPTVDVDGNIDIPATTITYTNTVDNPASAGFQSNVTVEPADANGVDLDGDGTLDTVYDPTVIPDGTTVTIFLDQGTAGLDSGDPQASYSYNANAGAWTTTDAPVIVDDQLTATEAPKDVGVSVTLPAVNDVDPESLPSYPIYLVVFPDNDPTNAPGYTGELTNNITIDRLYPAGYVTLVKRVRILDADGGFIYPSNGSYTDPATDGSFPDVAPGQVLEYQITYTNISETQVGIGNIILLAEKLVIAEDGTDSPNNWALDNDVNGFIDTIHQQGAASTSNVIRFIPAATGADLTFTSTAGSTTDPADGTPIEAYLNIVGTVNPGQSGTFTFKRKLEGSAAPENPVPGPT